jgi:hypothetical protein
VRESVDGRDAALVAELALVQALAQRERGRRPWVSVTGTPEAAFVSIDGRDVGLVPWEGEVAPGEREVRVHLPGYEPFTQAITAAPGAPVELEVALRPVTSGGGLDATAQGALIGTGIAAVVAGMIIGGLGIAYATQAGSCADLDCRTVPGLRAYTFGDTEAGLIAGGTVAIIGGGAAIVLAVTLD